MKYATFTFEDSNFIVLHKRTTYRKPEGRKTWPKEPTEIGTEEFCGGQKYQNFVTSVPFFNNFGGKAYCRASFDYTAAGYLPTEITTVNPDATVKHVDRFAFVFFPMYDARRSAGFRERDVMDHCDRVDLRRDGEHFLATFYADDEHTATFDAATRKWVG